MTRKELIHTLAVCVLAPSLFLAYNACTSAGKDLPCDIYRKGGTPCVAAHSTTRLLDSKYSGPLYQVRRASDDKTLDIKAGKDGLADAAAQDRFLEGTIGYISMIYDQSGMGNDLVPAAPGTFKGPDKGEFNTQSIADMAPVLVNGRKAYGIYVMPGMGYRCNNARGLAINDEAEGIYYVIDGKHFDSGCCFDYGNSSTNGKAVGTGTMETTYFGTATAWGSGNGDGPWIMADMEAGLFSGYNAKKNDVPSIDSWDILSVFVNGGDGNQWDLRGGDATKDELVTYYSGVRPGTPDSDDYFPMHKKGGMLLGNGGDNGNGSAGTFYEGVMTFGYPSDETIAAVQKNIASLQYTRYPLSVSRITSFTPGECKAVSVAFVNTTGKELKDVELNVSLPEGWAIAGDAPKMAALAPDGHYTTVLTIAAPEQRSAGFASFEASWKGGSLALSERVRCSEPVKVNEVYLSAAGGSTADQFIELYNAGDEDVDISGLNIDIRRSGWASLTAAVIPQGTVMAPGSFYGIALAPSAVTAPAAKGADKVFLSKDIAAGQTVTVASAGNKIAAAGKPAGAFTTIFSPVSTGPRMSIAKGAKNIPVTTIEGFAEGEYMGIDLGGNYEVVKISSVGTPATQTTLKKEAAVGDTQVYLETTSTLRPGDVITIDTGARVELAEVKTVVKSVDTPAPRRFWEPEQIVEPGIVELTKPIERYHMVEVDVSCPGTGISFEPALAHDHISGDAVQPLGLPYTLSEPLSADVCAYAPVTLNRPGVIECRTCETIFFGYPASESAGSIALVDPADGVLFDAVVYGSQQSSSSANGTIASPELATLEGDQNGGGSIAVVPAPPRRFGPNAIQVTVPAHSLVRIPDGEDTDNLSIDFKCIENPTPGLPNSLE
ncbi:MAG: lamin tail domain-containing protein [Bacteroidales bacterium]|nr:lamin tail domain-containing protein [Candidatus Cryptobacteroides caccocaballi]